MKTIPARQTDDKSAIARIREATRRQHLDLHEHPLIVALLSAPALNRYGAVLAAFLEFYQTIEESLVESARRFEMSEQYAAHDRTMWLQADLAWLAENWSQGYPPPPEPRLDSPRNIGELMGWLYVVKGSALGGQAILRRLESEVDIGPCSRFFRGDGPLTSEYWLAFQAHCDNCCRTEEMTQAAIESAGRAFTLVAEYMTRSLRRWRSGTAHPTDVY